MNQVRDGIYRLEDSDLRFLQSISTSEMDFEEIYQSIDLDGFAPHIFLAEGKEVSIGLMFEGYFVPHHSDEYERILNVVDG